MGYPKYVQVTFGKSMLRWGQFGRVLTLVMLVASCGGPSVRMMGVSSTRVTVESSVFEVYVKGNVAQAVRTNFEFPARTGTIFPRARIAIEQASGCPIRENAMSGDAALITAELNCARD